MLMLEEDDMLLMMALASRSAYLMKKGCFQTMIAQELMRVFCSDANLFSLL
jgi:hypothetical protein